MNTLDIIELRIHRELSDYVNQVVELTHQFSCEKHALLTEVHLARAYDSKIEECQTAFQETAKEVYSNLSLNTELQTIEITEMLVSLVNTIRLPEPMKGTAFSATASHIRAELLLISSCIFNNLVRPLSEEFKQQLEVNPCSILTRREKFSRTLR